MPVLVDSCVLLDVLTKDPVWYQWSSAMLEEGMHRGRVVINAVIFAEISVRFDSVEELEERLPPDLFDYQPIVPEAAFLAGKCYVDYRRRGGKRDSPLPDFFIGAHAAVAGLPVLTRDTRRFVQHFPALQLIAPPKGASG